MIQTLEDVVVGSNSKQYSQSLTNFHYAKTMTLPPNPFMAMALAQAEDAAAAGEVPIGCVIVSGQHGDILAKTHNRTLELNDPTAHAELLAIRMAAAKIGSQRLVECDLYVTLEPCSMCASAISFARIRRLYYGASDLKGGGVEHGVRVFSHSTCHHVPEIYTGIGDRRASELLKTFFRERR